MKRLVLTVVLAGAATLTACGGTEVTCAGPGGGQEGQVMRCERCPCAPALRPRRHLRLAARGIREPEPEIPADLMVLQDSIAGAGAVDALRRRAGALPRQPARTCQRAWTRLSRASGQYVVACSTSSMRWKRRSRDGQRQMNQAFDRFQGPAGPVRARAQETRLAREQWADAAYNDVERIIAARLRELRRRSGGHAGRERHRAAARARAWPVVGHARYDLPFEELYWNIPITVERGEPAQVQLTRQTAEVRPKL
jgi:hypothetical protein